MKKKLMTLLLALVMAVSAMAMPATAADTAGVFRDVTDEETLLAVESLRLMGALDGYEDGTFRPDEYLTRAQFCKIAVYAMNGESELGLYRTITVFPDVKSSHWASAYVNMTAKGKGLIAGYPDGSFHPEETVTAGQAVTILLRLLGYQDQDIGGVWPESYMALAERIGLTEGVEADGRAPLNRGETARLFLNLLRSQGKDGGRYLDSIGGRVIEDVVLVSSSAVGSDGRPTAMQTSNGDVYTMANKASRGVFNGRRGDLVLNRQGKVLTFVPTDIGSGSTVTIASASATKITAANGAKFTVSREAQAYYGGEQKAWSEVYAWLNAGTAATLYTGASGSVEYVFVGSAAAVLTPFPAASADTPSTKTALPPPRLTCASTTWPPILPPPTPSACAIPGCASITRNVLPVPRSPWRSLSSAVRSWRYFLPVWRASRLSSPAGR